MFLVNFRKDLKLIIPLVVPDTVLDRYLAVLENTILPRPAAPKNRSISVSLPLEKIDGPVPVTALVKLI